MGSRGCNPRIEAKRKLIDPKASENLCEILRRLRAKVLFPYEYPAFHTGLPTWPPFRGLKPLRPDGNPSFPSLQTKPYSQQPSPHQLQNTKTHDFSWCEENMTERWCWRFFCLAHCFSFRSLRLKNRAACKLWASDLQSFQNVVRLDGDE